MRTTKTAYDPAFTGTVSLDGIAYNVFTDSTAATNPYPWVQTWRVVPVIAGADDTADADASGGDSPDDTDDDTTPSDDTTTDEKKFTQKDVNSIVAREVSKKTRGKLDPKELGFDSAAAMKTWIDEQKAKSDSEKTEAERALEDAKKAAADEARQEVMSKADEKLLRAEFKILAVDAGVEKGAIDDAFLLAQAAGLLDEVEVDDKGTVTGIDEELFTQLKEAKPFLFAPATTETKGGAGVRAGGGKTPKTGSGLPPEAFEHYPALTTGGRRVPAPQGAQK